MKGHASAEGVMDGMGRVEPSVENYTNTTNLVIS